MFLKNVVDEASNHDFVMQRSIGSETKHFYTNGHLRQPTPFSGECWMWPNQRIWQMAQFCIQHQFKLEVYQIFFKKSILHQKTLIFPIHHLFFFWLLGGSKWVWSSKKPVSRWIRFGVNFWTSAISDLYHFAYILPIWHDFERDLQKECMYFASVFVSTMFIILKKLFSYWHLASLYSPIWLVYITRIS